MKNLLKTGLLLIVAATLALLSFLLIIHTLNHTTKVHVHDYSLSSSEAKDRGRWIRNYTYTHALTSGKDSSNTEIWIEPFIERYGSFHIFSRSRGYFLVCKPSLCLESIELPNKCVSHVICYEGNGNSPFTSYTDLANMMDVFVLDFVPDSIRFIQNDEAVPIRENFAIHERSRFIDSASTILINTLSVDSMVIYHVNDDAPEVIRRDYIRLWKSGNPIQRLALEEFDCFTLLDSNHYLLTTQFKKAITLQELFSGDSLYVSSTNIVLVTDPCEHIGSVNVSESEGYVHLLVDIENECFGTDRDSSMNYHTHFTP